MHASTKWLIGQIVVLVIASTLLGLFNYPLVLPYSWHKLLHIFGAIIFVGNIIVTGAWMLLAERTRDQAVLRFASPAVNWADVFFTAPGVMLVLLNGLILSARWGGVFQSSWIAAALALFTLSGIVWVGFLVPYQFQLIGLSSASRVANQELSQEFFRVLHKWYFWGTVATVLPLVSLVFMVVKPRLW